MRALAIVSTTLLVLVLAVAAYGTYLFKTEGAFHVPDVIEVLPEGTQGRLQRQVRNLTKTPTSLIDTSGIVMWRSIVITDEDRCSPYDADDYLYSPSVEARIVEGLGGIVYGPYTGRHFEATTETDIEHIVARSEAHDGVVCER